MYLPPTQTVSCEETMNTPPEREAERIVSDVAETAQIESVEKLNNQAWLANQKASVSLGYIHVAVDLYKTI